MACSLGLPSAVSETCPEYFSSSYVLVAIDYPIKVTNYSKHVSQTVQGSFFSVINSMVSESPDVTVSQWCRAYGGELVETYGSGLRDFDNMVDLYKSVYQEAHIMSVGPDKNHAAVFAPKFGDGSSYIDGRSVVSSLEVVLGEDQILTQLANLVVVHYSNSGDPVVQLSDTVIDLKGATEFEFFSEIAILNVLAENSEAYRTLGLYSITIKARDMILNYPDCEMEISSLVNSAVDRFLSSLRQFRKDVHGEIVLVDLNVSVSNIDSVLLHDGPFLFAGTNYVASIEKACKDVRSQVGNSRCGEHIGMMSYMSYTVLAVNDTNSTVSSDSVARFQISLWISVILAFATYGAVYALAFMENRKDTVLYSRFNPQSMR